MQTVGLLDLFSLSDGWRDEMAAWLVVGMQVSNSVIDKDQSWELNVSLMGPLGRGDDNQAYLRLEGVGPVLQGLVKRMRELDRGKTVLQLAGPSGKFPVWDEKECET